MEPVTRVVVAQDELSQVVRDWLTEAGRSPDAPIELYFLSDELLIRPRSSDNKDLENWLEDAMSRYDSLLQRLASA
jgi:hypothetical protein